MMSKLNPILRTTERETDSKLCPFQKSPICHDNRNFTNEYYGYFRKVNNTSSRPNSLKLAKYSQQIDHNRNCYNADV